MTDDSNAPRLTYPLCARCGHVWAYHGPWPFEEDKSMRCHTCTFDPDSDGIIECACPGYVEPAES